MGIAVDFAWTTHLAAWCYHSCFCLLLDGFRDRHRVCQSCPSFPSNFPAYVRNRLVGGRAPSSCASPALLKHFLLVLHLYVHRQKLEIGRDTKLRRILPFTPRLGRGSAWSLFLFITPSSCIWCTWRLGLPFTTTSLRKVCTVGSLVRRSGRPAPQLYPTRTAAATDKPSFKPNKRPNISPPT